MSCCVICDSFKTTNLLIEPIKLKRSINLSPVGLLCVRDCESLCMSVCVCVLLTLWGHKSVYILTFCGQNASSHIIAFYGENWV